MRTGGSRTKRRWKPSTPNKDSNSAVRSENMADLAVKETSIPGLFEIDLVVHGDSRGWFKENYQRAKLEALGLPHFEIVQNNFSYNEEVGVTRGIHAEPWEK